MSDQCKLPNEQGYWWWWNGDEDALPVPVDISKDSDGNFFATKGQLGWDRFQFVGDMGGFWIKLHEPSIEALKGGENGQDRLRARIKELEAQLLEIGTEIINILGIEGELELKSNDSIGEQPKPRR